jgi:hypothetical protein
MGWDRVLEKHRQFKESMFVSCEDWHEREFLKAAIGEEFPGLGGAQVDAALRHCCLSYPAPRARDRYFSCLRRRLGGPL